MEQPPRRKRNYSLPAVVVVVLLFYGVYVVALWRFGLFDLDAESSDARVVAAILSLSGGLLASSLTLVGVLLKHSIDVRNAEMADEAEKRLRLEASMRAVNLLTLENGAPASGMQQAGALFILTSLNQFTLAIALLGELWRKGNISSRAAVEVVNQSLLSGEAQAKLSAGAILGHHADLLPYPDGDGGYAPECLNLKWPTDLPGSVRLELLRALLLVLLSRDAAGWMTNRAYANYVMLEVNLARTTEPDPTLSANACVALHALLHSELQFDGYFADPYDTGENVDVNALKVEIDQLHADAQPKAGVDFTELANRIRAIQ